MAQPSLFELLARSPDAAASSPRRMEKRSRHQPLPLPPHHRKQNPSRRPQLHSHRRPAPAIQFRQQLDPHRNLDPSLEPDHKRPQHARPPRARRLDPSRAIRHRRVRAASQRNHPSPLGTQRRRPRLPRLRHPSPRRTLRQPPFHHPDPSLRRSRRSADRLRQRRESSLSARRCPRKRDRHSPSPRSNRKTPHPAMANRSRALSANRRSIRITRRRLGRPRPNSSKPRDPPAIQHRHQSITLHASHLDPVLPTLGLVPTARRAELPAAPHHY